MPGIENLDILALSELNAFEIDKYQPFLRAWSWGIDFDNITNLSEYQKTYGHRLRLIALSAILERPPQSLRPTAEHKLPFEALVNANFATDTIVDLYPDKYDEIHELHKKVQPGNKAHAESLPTRFMYNVLEQYTFETDCKPYQYARHIHMHTLAEHLGLKLSIKTRNNNINAKRSEDLNAENKTNENAIQVYSEWTVDLNAENNANENAIQVYAKHQDVRWDPDFEKHGTIKTPNQTTSTVHDGNCGYHTILLLLKAAWDSLDQGEKERLTTHRAQFFKPYNQKELIHPDVSYYSSCQQLGSASIFSYRLFGYGALATVISAAAYMMGWAALLALLTSPAGAIAVATVVIAVLIVETTAMNLPQHSL